MASIVQREIAFPPPVFITRELLLELDKLIETNKELGLIEKPEYKRRWNSEPWAEQEQRAREAEQRRVQQERQPRTEPKQEQPPPKKEAEKAKPPEKEKTDKERRDEERKKPPQ